MTGEAPPGKLEGKPIPFDTVLDNSFLASQGDTELQNRIFYYLLTGPFKHRRAELRTYLFREGVVAAHAHEMALSGTHLDAVDLRYTEKSEERLDAEREQREILKVVLDEVEKAAAEGMEEALAEDKRTELVRDFIERDVQWYQRGGRPVKQDQWASFIIDFCLFKTGMKRRGFSFSKNLLPAFQTMCEEVSVRLRSGAVSEGDASAFCAIVETYLAHHPRLSDKRRAELATVVSILNQKYP